MNYLKYSMYIIRKESSLNKTKSVSNVGYGVVIGYTLGHFPSIQRKICIYDRVYNISRKKRLLRYRVG